MTPLWIRSTAILAAIGSGLVAGTFFAFSTFVMRALDRLPASQAVAAMQSINIAVVNPLFMGVFMGTAALSLALAIGAGMRLGTPGAGLVLAASLLYLLGTFLVTVVGNVPLNDALAAVKPEQTGDAWPRYLAAWSLWNHVRAIAATGALIVFILGLMQISGEH